MTASTPLPEPQWAWRRLVVWVVSAFSMFQLHWLLQRIPPDQIAAVADRLLLLLAMLMALYLIGPTAEHIVALVRAWRGTGQ